MMDSVATSGLVATVPKHTITSEGLPITSFRLASSQRRFNKNTNQWEYGATNWFTVSAFRQLAQNLSSSINKGDRVVVIGRMRIREWQKDGKSGTIVEISADSVGHDLNWGSAAFSRTVRAVSTAQLAEESSADSRAFDPDEGRRAAVDGNGWAVPNGSSAVSASDEPSSAEPVDLMAS